MMFKKDSYTYEKNKEIAKFLEKNKNFLIKNSYLLKILEFPSNWKSKGKIIDFNAHKSEKLKKENDILKLKISNILNTGSNNFNSQKRVLKASLLIMNAKNWDNYVKILKEDCKALFNVDIININSNHKKLINYNNQKNLKEIDSKISNKFFINNNHINLQNREEYLSMFFPLIYKKIKSYILLKININKKYFLIISFGSKNKEKFSIKQGSELITFFVKVCENKIQNLINQK